MGMGYSFMNIADKTTNYSLRQVYRAAILALNQLGIKISSTAESEKGTRINAETERLGIAIELEKITVKTTKMSVIARKEMFLKDRSTAKEIIRQTQQILDEQTKQKPPFHPDSGKGDFFKTRIEPSADGEWL